ncbi:uncharacterized protein LOC123321598 [Coccinella septempunctata]|uniref:uncharacterized protein LOC123321598 n=1 Tax=Coccinella septempunctata TaxID=41139 RepID=UPI001D097B20|nr:uncharacterized protein LOC123321598 [Coccinella septempunctata]
MERVLKRVGLSKRTESDVALQNTNAPEDSKKVRRRRRSKSRRQPSQDINKKTRGLFNIDWESVKDCKSCKSRAITKKFCSKRSDNELYRSNSFKFERFIRGSEESSSLSKKISLCDEYSLPADYLHKKRPNSIAVPSLSEWNPSSPNEEKIEILETYSNPRDSRQQLSQEEDTKCLTSPDREYSQPYTTDGSSEPTSDEEFFGHQITITKHIELNSPDSITDSVFPQLGIKSPIKVEAEVKRHPSPYYYGDLFKNRSESPSKPELKTTKSLDQPSRKQEITKVAKDVLTTKSHNNQRNKTSQKKYRKCTSLQNPNSRHVRARSQNQQKYQKSSSVDTQSTDSKDVPHELVMPPNRYVSPCDCMTTEYGLDDEMTRQRHVYETAFDCRINKSDDDLDQIDQVSNHPILIQLSSVKDLRTTNSVDKNSTHSRRNVSLHCPKPSQVDNNINNLSQDLQNIHIPEEGISGTSGVLSLPLRGFTPSPPSTAPLPTKFHGKELVMNSIRSAPNLPSHPRARLKDLHLPVKSLRGRTNTSSSGSLQIPGSNFDIEIGQTNIISEFKGRPSHSRENKQERIMEIKDRPRKDSIMLKRGKENGKTVLDFMARRPKYSSTESMTTSSSGGSMESIKSSTSEGNRSTTSDESRHSSSLSSHSSDSAGNPKYPIIQTSAFLSQANKLHILSPISDKSSQEPISETSDNNRNNNSQKCSPEEVAIPEIVKNKRRLPQNKNLLNLGFRIGDPEIQGSDSGISIQSREGIKSRFGFTAAEINVPSQPDLSDLPFDMPKLRRRRLVPTQDACTSGSATSVDVRDLPFDMPKLRRRMRIQQSTNESVSQASSSQSVVEADREATSYRPKLTLNLGEFGNRQRPCLGLALMGLNLNLNNPPAENTDLIDINLPLEKQGWFHGAITRVEAENVLRLLEEGSFLVRNSESTKQDFSLSLKSAKGFMHMRIQKSDSDGCYILGQFSKPFSSIPEMIRHFSINRLPIRGAEHMCLLQPVIVQLL